MKKILLKVVLTIAVVTFVGLGAFATDTGTAYANYNEECLNEGCSNEEVLELYNSYRNECLDNCYYEEVHELAGGDRVPPNKVLDSSQLHYRMFSDFDSRFHWFFYPCYDGYTTPPWNQPDPHYFEGCWLIDY